jgi:hypothetical protein
MKSLLINLILCIFFISCAPTIRPYKEKNCSWLLREKATIQEEIKQIKETEEYKKESKKIAITYPVIVPFCVVAGPFCGLFENYTPQHNKVHNLGAYYDDLKNEDKYFKHCSKDH